MDTQTIALIVGLIILVSTMLGIGGLVMSTVSNKKRFAITTFCVFGFFLIQSQAFLIIEFHDDVADAKGAVRRAKKRVADAKTALSECKQKGTGTTTETAPPYDNPCWREQIGLRYASLSLISEEETLKDSKAQSLLIGVPLIGIIGILVVIVSIVLAIIFKQRNAEQGHPDP